MILRAEKCQAKPSNQPDFPSACPPEQIRRCKPCDLTWQLSDSLLIPKGEFTMWPKKNANPDIHRTKAKLHETTIISPSSKLEGRFETDGSLIIDGSVTGTIKCGSLEIMENGNVDANVETETATVAGNFAGEMICKGKLTFFRRGKVKGDISYGTLSIESGGLLDGAVSKLK
jgi:cytoskeletal protein CcmA (bactofilin family)